MEEYVINVIQWNFIGAASLLTLFLFMQSDLTFDKPARKYFTLTGGAIILLIIFDALEMYFHYPSDDPFIQNVHTVLYAICYADKPMIVMFLLFIILRQEHKTKVLYWIPSVINIIAALSTLICPWVFSYHAHNVFQRGMLGYTAHLTALFYAMLIVNESLKRFKDKNYYEGATVIWILIITMTATILDTETNMRLVNSASAMCLLLYYFYFYFQLSKRDVMTGVFNRNAYYADVLMFEKQISALMLFNISGLELDEQKDGETAWKESLLSMVNIVSKNVYGSSRIYRIKGDEIAVLCLNQQKESIRIVFDNIKKAMKTSDYMFASGLAFNDRHNGTDELLSRASDAMKIDKSNIRVGRIFRQRQLAAEKAMADAGSSPQE
ncbi:MAG: GGDEF domain-containing protein [Spirochaetales bacterium]|nr:GGDEF domain-containing protein [Spirochaetales bacterium]